MMQLFQTADSPFAQLVSAVRDRRPDQLATWLRTVKADDLDKLIDAASADVSPSKPPMYGNHRKRVLRLLKGILDDTRTVVALSPGLENDLDRDFDTEHLLAIGRPLADRCAVLLPELIADAEAMSGPEASFVRDVLESLTLLQEWACLRLPTEPPEPVGAT